MAAATCLRGWHCKTYIIKLPLIWYSLKVDVLQVVLTSVFALNEPEFDGFYCNSTSICSLDRSSSSHPFTPVTYFDRKPHFHVSMLIVARQFT